MSQETMTWLNRYVLLGGTDWRGTQWHYMESEQGDEPNHYPQFVPPDDVLRRLFPTEVELVPTAHAVRTERALADFERNGIYYRWVPMARQAVIPGDPDGLAELRDPETGLSDPLGVHGMDYVSHQYRDWLLERVANLLDDDLGITSAGLIKGGRIAWVEVALPGDIDTPEGFRFRPYLLNFTSHDGTYASTHKLAANASVCDNTFRANTYDNQHSYRTRHTRLSTEYYRVLEAREAVGLIHRNGEVLTQQIAELAAQKVSEREWQAVMDKLAPAPKPTDTVRVRNNADRKRDQLQLLWVSDERVAPWRGTGLGVVQAYSTWFHHKQRGGADPNRRAERNFYRAIIGHDADKSAEVRAVLADVQR